MSSEKVIVRTPLGELEGETFNGLAGDTIFSFQGVPFAKPPVGNLRFQDPVPIAPWSGILDAKHAPPPSAALIPYFKNIPPTLMPGCSEDSLYLNLYTPVYPKPGDKYPVMAYIHGGGFTFGTSNRDGVGPDYLVPQGVILVTINYRVGPLGFLSLNTNKCPGNFGLKDQTLGLRWVKENISSFGGDPDNVTLFGESAGAASVHYHLLSPLSRGLFHRVIAQSGSVLNRWAVSRYPRESALLLAKRMGCTSDDLSKVFNFLQAAHLKDLLVNSKGIFEEIEGIWAFEDTIDAGFVPCVEPLGTPNAFLTMTPQEAVKKGFYADVPFIAGCCTHEAIFCLPSADFVPPYKDDLDFQVMLPKELGVEIGTPSMLEAAKILREHYFPNGVAQEGYVKAGTSLFFNYGVLKTIEAHCRNPKRSSPDYLYMLTGSREEPSTIKQLLKYTNVPGVCHGEDLDYLFTGVQGTTRKNPIKPGTRDHKIQNLFIQLWTEFAKTGKPRENWSAATIENGFSYADIAETLTVRKGFIAEEVALWDRIYALLEKSAPVR